MWKSLLTETPEDGQTVWVRVINIYGQLAEATYSRDNQTFQISVTKIIIPAYQVSRWKEL